MRTRSSASRAESVRLSNRSSKKPLRNLPEALEISPDTTVEAFKKSIARHVGISDFNRIGLFDPATDKTVKDRLAKVAELNKTELQVQDLGRQIRWKTVFVIEYIGPIIFHLLAIPLRPYIYPFAKNPTNGPLSTNQWMGFAMIVLHFARREFETLFVHRFSANTMPARNVLKNSFFYWALAGLLAAYTIYSPDSPAAHAHQPLVDVVATLVYLFGEVANAAVHLHLAGLRSNGGTERRIPTCPGADLVTCPNYMFEVISWLGVIVATRDWAVALFIAVGTYQMNIWARAKEAAYRREFGGLYKKKRFVMLPGLL